MNVTDINLPVAVLGAGPVGLAAAAHLVARGMTPLIFEASENVAGNLATYRHVRLFSPWQYNVDKAALRLLVDAGWPMPAEDDLPAAGEIIDQYLQPLAQLPAIAAHLKLGHRVVQVSRQGFDKVKTRGRELAPFIVRAVTASGEREYFVSAVIDATGTWSHPNPLGASGIDAIGEITHAARIAYGMPDVLGAERHRYAGQRVLVAGSGHSAAGTLIALAQLAEEEPGTTLVWAVRGAAIEKAFGGGSADGLPARGALGTRLKALQASGKLEIHTRFRIHALEVEGNALRVVGDEVDGNSPVIDGVDQIVASTGARPNLELTRELRVRHDPWLESTDALAPLIDPNEHSCGTVRPHGHRELAHPEPGYYAVGAKSYGRATNFLMATGYEQVRSVVAALAGDLAQADDVQLELPETGVCSTRLEYGVQLTPTSCCGGPAPAGSAACCVQDADAKTQGKAGCGCSDPVPSLKAKSCCA
ncbi:Pyridine nucleotide-disulphide oxidoreductase [Duganella sacchari]|uniref:Pyridine nucleotide-disulphide oxidoreductase n=1 Tax=Duganella sacchari TaxID=551987 RepID=A0A1M7RBH8_9BURK|nr:NAD(P)-binding domain-containing protein [Duganella sacchari]SHN43576.1 Pyridine nucleotide-disulphide oxidoreductase [Duganella sacchari]